MRSSRPWRTSLKSPVENLPLGRVWDPRGKMTRAAINGSGSTEWAKRRCSNCSNRGAIKKRLSSRGTRKSTLFLQTSRSMASLSPLLRELRWQLFLKKRRQSNERLLPSSNHRSLWETPRNLWDFRKKGRRKRRRFRKSKTPTPFTSMWTLQMTDRSELSSMKVMIPSS